MPALPRSGYLPQVTGVFPAGTPQNGGDRLQILYFNDIHEKYRAYPRLKTAFDYYGQQAAQSGADVLKLSAGDWNVGKEPNEIKLNVMLNNLLGIVASSPGNHEYDTGIKGFSDALALANFKTLATNLHVPASSSLYKRFTDQKLLTGPWVYTTPRGQRYGFVGITVPHAWKYLNPSVKMEGVASLGLDQSIQRIQNDVNLLRQQGIRRIILLSHAGYKGDLEIARRTSGINIIVGGHSHDELQGIVPNVNYVRSARGEPVIIVQAGMNGTFGQLEVLWDPYDRAVPRFHQIYNHRNFPDHPQAVGLINSVLGPEQVIGQMAEEVSHKNAGAGGENGAASRIADAILMAVNRLDPAGVDIALFRGTEMRNDILKGPFTTRDLSILLPFTDKLVKFQMTGAQLQEALDESARCIKEKETHPGMMHPAGLRYTVDARMGKAVRVEVLNRKLNKWEALQPEKRYTVATGDFLEKNKKEYPVFKKAPVVARYNITLRDAFGAYIQSQNGRPVSFPLDGRIKIITGESPSPWPAPNPKSLVLPPSNAFASAHGYTTLPMFAANPLPFTHKASV